MLSGIDCFFYGRMRDIQQSLKTLDVRSLLKQQEDMKQTNEVW